MYKLKKLIERGTTLGAAIALSVGAVVPAIVPAIAHADALNPLTDRSLTLSSSSPGWSHTDGSENPTYAPPNSGANGQKTGNYFDFKVSSGATVKAMTFQYCTSPAGTCEIPGNDVSPGTDTASTSDLNVDYPSASEVGSSVAGSGTIELENGSTAVVGDTTDFTNEVSVGDLISTPAGHTYKVATITDGTNIVLASPAVEDESGVAYEIGDFAAVVNTGDTNGTVKYVPGYAGYDDGKPGGQSGIGGNAASVTGTFIVMSWDGSKWVQSTGWDAAASKVTDGLRTTNNYITITNSTGAALTSGQRVKVLFFANDTNYITNPGAGAFFVRMNTYSSDTDVDSDHVIDGGVTVANVMNQSIWIQTKVLETMQFSVGTVDPNTLPSDDGTWVAPGDAGNIPSTLEKALHTDPGQTGLKLGGQTTHGICDEILGNITPNDPYNVLKMGNSTAENSLETGHTYSTHSFWRLSSNSSAGATVYYSGHTLTNTVGDEITPIGQNKAYPLRGSEQFGLAIATAVNGGSNEADLQTSYAQEATYESGNDFLAGVPLTAIDSSTTADTTGNASWHTPTLYPLVPTANYSEGTGAIDGGGGARFAFVGTSDTVPVPIASEDNQVVDCVTAKMRYIANVAATTPAGIYTTKVNYIAAPQY